MKLDLAALSSRPTRLRLPVGDRTLEIDGAVELEEGHVGTEDGVTRIRWERGQLTPVTLTLGDVRVRLDRLELGSSTVEVIRGRGTRVQVSRAAGRSLQASGPFGRVEADTLDLPQGLSVSPEGRVLVPAAELAHVRVHAPLAPGDRRSPEDPGEASRPPLLPDSQAVIAKLLDSLEGRVHVDLDVDLEVPIIKRRKATHQFRLEVTEGTIDYRQLERGLAGLEEAILDFKHRGDRLKLKRDIPLVPFDAKSLVTWTLSAAEIELADQGRVRLARLLRPDPSPSDHDAEPGKSAPVALREAQALLLDVLLHARGPQSISLAGNGALRLGSAELDAIPGLRLSGRVATRPEDPDPSPTQVRAELPRLALAASDLDLGGAAALSLGSLLAESLGVDLGFAGLTPSHLTATLGGVQLRGFALGKPAAP